MTAAAVHRDQPPDTRGGRNPSDKHAGSAAAHPDGSGPYTVERFGGRYIVRRPNGEGVYETTTLRQVEDWLDHQENIHR